MKETRMAEQMIDGHASNLNASSSASMSRSSCLTCPTGEGLVSQEAQQKNSAFSFNSFASCSCKRLQLCQQRVPLVFAGTRWAARRPPASFQSQRPHRKILQLEVY